MSGEHFFFSLTVIVKNTRKKQSSTFRTEHLPSTDDLLPRDNMQLNHSASSWKADEAQTRLPCEQPKTSHIPSLLDAMSQRQ